MKTTTKTRISRMLSVLLVLIMLAGVLCACDSEAAIGDLNAAAGKDGADGKDGKDGADGKDGKDGVSVTDVRINGSGELIFTFSNGQQINVGKVSGGSSGSHGNNNNNNNNDNNNNNTPDVFEVSFDLNYAGAENAPDTQYIVSGQKVVIPEDPARDGFEFDGWYLDSDCENDFNIYTTAVTSAITLYAKWISTSGGGSELTLTVNGSEFQQSASSVDVYFYAATTVSVSGISLYANDGNNTCLIEMFDDGDYSSHGDDIMGDGIYSCIYSVNCETAGTQTYYAADSDGALTSNLAEITIFEPLTQEEVDNINQVNDDISTLMTDTSFAELPKEEQAAAVETKLTELAQEQELIVNNSIQYDEANGAFSFVYSSGTVGGIMMNNSSEGATMLAGGSNKKAVSGKAVMIPYSDAVTPAVATLGKAVIMYGWDDINNADSLYESYTSVAGEWTDAGLKTDVKLYPTVEDYRTALSGNKVIVIAEHGNVFSSGFLGLQSTPMICTSEEITLQKCFDYSEDLKKHRVLLITYMDGTTSYGLTPSFFKHYYGDNKLDNSIVYMDNCRGMGTEASIFDTDYDYTLANAFLSSGADTVVGYYNSVFAAYGSAMMKSFVDGLISGMTTQQAFDEAKIQWGENDKIFAETYFSEWNGKEIAQPVLVGADDKKLLEEDFFNGSFEEGLTSWNSEGDVRVLQKLAALLPTHGSHMAILTTGVGSGTSDYTSATEGSVLAQTFVVPEGVKRITFSYNVVSEEPMEYVGSQYDDKFTALLSAPGQEDLTMAYETVNNSTWYAIEGIDFDGGDSTAYETGWIEAEYDVSSYVGQTITVKFVVYDVGDSLYDTAALIDNIQFHYTEAE